MEKFSLILNSSVDNLTTSEKEFLDIHNKILYYGVSAAHNLLQMSKQLELMKNNKNYLDAGFDSFESYCEDALGLKRSQAYNYIKVANSYSNDFLIKNNNIGITKLLILSNLDETVADKVVETIDVTDTKVTELQELVKSLKQELKDKEVEFKTNLTLKESEVKLKEEKISELNNLLLDKEENYSEKNDIPDDDIELRDRIKVLEEEIKNKETESKQKIKELKEKIKDKEVELSKIESLNKSNVINQNPELIKFKVKFNDVKRIVEDMKVMIFNFDNEEKEKCKNALNALLRSLIYE